MLLCCITLSSLRENERNAQEVARRIFGAVAGESTQKVNIPSTHHNPYLSHYIICHLPLVFLSPTHPCRFIRRFFPYAFLFVFPHAFYLLASLLAKNLLIWIHLKCSTWIIFDPYVLMPKPQLA